jgi:hypothetical protein
MAVTMQPSALVVMQVRSTILSVARAGLRPSLGCPPNEPRAGDCPGPRSSTPDKQRFQNIAGPPQRHLREPKGPHTRLGHLRGVSRARQSAEVTEQHCRARGPSPGGDDLAGARVQQGWCWWVPMVHPAHLRDCLATRRIPLLLRGSSVTEQLRVAGTYNFLR